MFEVKGEISPFDVRAGRGLVVGAFLGNRFGLDWEPATVRQVKIPETSDLNCYFCRIVHREVASRAVFEDEISLAFLDHRPLFPGHLLLVPKEHYETLADLPASLIEPLFRNARLLAQAMEIGLKAEGSFVAINNRISQIVPHLHVHIVPRRKKDGLRGFFWPRQKYADEVAIAEVQETLRAAIAQVLAAR